MVSLENKISYIERINENPKLRAFHHFLLEKNVLPPSDNNQSDTNGLFLGIISSIQRNNKEQFQQIYSKKSKSNPSKDSPLPFVNDDFLIFCLIVGITKFNIDKSWIKNIVSIRSRNSTTITLENILTENYFSTSNIHEVILAYFQLTDQSLITNDVLNNAYKSIAQNTILFESRSDFQILCAIRAYDLVIELKEAPKGSEIYLFRQFNERFVKRVKILSWIVQAIVLFGLLYAIMKLPIYLPETVELIDKYNYVFTVLGALGFTLLGNQIPFIRNKAQELIMRAFGYPKDLVDMLQKTQN